MDGIVSESQKNPIDQDNRGIPPFAKNAKDGAPLTFLKGEGWATRPVNDVRLLFQLFHRVLQQDAVSVEIPLPYKLASGRRRSAKRGISLAGTLGAGANCELADLSANCSTGIVPE